MEAIRRLQELVSEFGDFELKVPDQLQHDWRRDVADFELESERDCITVVID